jgi:hypothetical protein
VSTVAAPFPWFGGKSRASAEVWRRFGDVPNYVEPFAGSLAVCLGRPAFTGRRTETINDLDGFIANFWRAVSHDPDGVAAHADWPVSEADLHARHAWLIDHRTEITDALHADPAWFDARTAGWWVWGICSWIGSGWCSGDGPWRVVDGKLTDTRSQLPHLGNAGRGINRQLPHLGDAGQGINRQLPHLGDAGRGINRQLPHLGDAGQGITAWMRQLADRLRDVRVCCGDWTRVVTDSVTVRHGITGVLLDPPYGDDHGDYYAVDSRTVATDVRDWCLANGNRSDLRIALCGYTSDTSDPLADAGWTTHRWSSKGGYGGGKGNQADANRRREAIWFSPHCLGSESLLDLLEDGAA